MYNNCSSGALLNVAYRRNPATDPHGRGSGESKDYGASPTLTKATFRGNLARYGGGIVNFQGANLRIEASIFWNDSSESDTIPGAGATISDRIISGGCPKQAVGTAVTCTDVNNSNPQLSPVADNGGFTQTMALGLGSPAIDAGGVNSTCALTDQRGIPRLQRRDCDIGAYEAATPVVSSVTRTDANPTSLSSIHFSVTFSESSTGIDISDFRLSTTGVSGAPVTLVSGSEPIYVVAVSTGSGNGTIRLDVVDDDSIKNGLDPLGSPGGGNGNFSSGEAYTVQCNIPGDWLLAG